MNPAMMVPRMARRMAWLAVLLLAVWGAALAHAAVGDQVELKATHQASVPLHQGQAHGAVRQITMPDFSASRQADPLRERSHDSRIYDTRFMLRPDRTSQATLQQLVRHFGVSKAAIIRQLIRRAMPDDFPTSWRLRAAPDGEQPGDHAVIRC